MRQVACFVSHRFCFTYIITSLAALGQRRSCNQLAITEELARPC